jgi:hypothetical protein
MTAFGLKSPQMNMKQNDRLKIWEIESILDAAHKLERAKT